MEEKLIYIPIFFNTHNWEKFKEEKFTKEWIDYRINIFMNYTFKSLASQSNQNFIACLIYDDKTDDLVKAALNRYKKFPESIRALKKSKSNMFLKNLLNDYKYLYLVRLDSDDLYNVHHIQFLHNYHAKDKTEALICQEGYIYDSINHRIVRCFFKSPPFYTLIYSSDDYLKGKRHNITGGHSGVINLNYEIIESKYLWNCHQLNTGVSDFNSRNSRLGIGEVIEENFQVNSILKNFTGDSQI